MSFLRTALVLVLSLSASGAEAVENPRVVIELFTSQGCSSCPPADRLLGEMAKEEGVIALTYPVTIWDHLGWHDTLATPANTARQRAYGEARGDRRIYTPQVIVNGVKHAVGSDRTAIDNKCRFDETMKNALSVPVSVQARAGGLRITTGAGTGDGASGAARLVLVVYDAEQRIRVNAGENEGQYLHYTNVVRVLKDLGPWKPDQMLDIPMPAEARSGSGIVVMVQTGTKGEAASALPAGVILGAASLPPRSGQQASGTH